MNGNRFEQTSVTVKHQRIGNDEKCLIMKREQLIEDKKVMESIISII